MAKDRDRGNKNKLKPPKNDKKHKGLPPHLQRQNDENNPSREINRHMDDVARRKPQ